MRYEDSYGKKKKYSHVESDKFSRLLNHVFAINWATVPPYLGLNSPSLAPLSVEKSATSDFAHCVDCGDTT